MAEAAFCFPLPAAYSDVEVAPLLCAGLIGYRSLVMGGSFQEATHLGIYGFGGAAHIVTQVALHEGRQVYAFTRSGKKTDQEFARSMGARGPVDRTNSPLIRWMPRLFLLPSGHWWSRHCVL